jgi:hypothetical protein
MQILYILYIYIRTRKVLSFVKYLRCLLYYLRWNIYSQTCHYILSFALWCPLRFPHRNDVRFVFTSSVGGFMSYLRYLCLFVYSGVNHILCIILFVYSGVNHILCSILFVYSGVNHILCSILFAYSGVNHILCSILFVFSGVNHIFV